MKRLFPFVILLLVVWFCVTTASAQDYIVRIYGDTIPCKVDRSTDRFVYYRTSKTKRDQQEIISRKEVEEVLYNADPSPDAHLGPWNRKEGKKRFELGAEGGYSRLLMVENVFGKEFDDYYAGLQNGFYFNGFVAYNFNESIGLGLTYSHSEYANDMSGVVLVPGNYTGSLSDDRVLDYYAVNLFYHPVVFRDGNRVSIMVGVGMLRFSGHFRVVFPYRLEAEALGANLVGAFEFSLGSGFYLPVRLGLKGFGVYGLEFTPGPDMPPELRSDLELLYGNGANFGFGRFEFGAGLSFAF